MLRTALVHLESWAIRARSSVESQSGCCDSDMTFWEVDTKKNTQSDTPTQLYVRSGPPLRQDVTMFNWSNYIYVLVWCGKRTAESATRWKSLRHVTRWNWYWWQSGPRECASTHAINDKKRGCCNIIQVMGADQLKSNLCRDCGLASPVCQHRFSVILLLYSIHVMYINVCTDWNDWR